MLKLILRVIKYKYCIIFDKNIKQMIRTTSLQHYKDLKSKGVNVQLVTKQDLKK